MLRRSISYWGEKKISLLFVAARLAYCGVNAYFLSVRFTPVYP